MTVILSATYAISLSLWEIMMDVMPSCLNLSSSSSRALESSSLREAVGSSRISSRAFLARALAISTICCFPTPISLINVWEDSLRPTVFK